MAAGVADLGHQEDALGACARQRLPLPAEAERVPGQRDDGAQAQGVVGEDGHVQGRVGEGDAFAEHRELLPPAFDLRKFERDAGLAGALDECSAAVEEMRVAVQDTFMAVAKRAVVAASAAYAHLQVASTTAQRLKRTVEKITPHANRSSVGEVVPAAVPEPSDSAKASVPAETAIKPTDKAA